MGHLRALQHTYARSGPHQCVWIPEAKDMVELPDGAEAQAATAATEQIDPRRLGTLAVGFARGSTPRLTRVRSQRPSGRAPRHLGHVYTRVIGYGYG